MFEKFNITDTDAAGGGGEYTVQVGFGWTNGVGESISLRSFKYSVLGASRPTSLEKFWSRGMRTLSIRMPG